MKHPSWADLRSMEEAHAEGLHADMKREFCPACADSPLFCSVCGGDHESVDCPSLNSMETI